MLLCVLRGTTGDEVDGAKYECSYGTLDFKVDSASRTNQPVCVV